MKKSKTLNYEIAKIVSRDANFWRVTVVYFMFHDFRLDVTNRRSRFSNWSCHDSTTGKTAMIQTVVFDLGSMFNHSVSGQNMGWETRPDERLCTIYRNEGDSYRRKALHSLWSSMVCRRWWAEDWWRRWWIRTPCADRA